MEDGAHRWFLDSTVGDRLPAWTRGNAADVFPEPMSPLAVTMYLRGKGIAAGLRDGYISLGVLDWDEFEEPTAPDLFKVFGGYVYNPLSLTRLLGARMPGATPEAIDKAFFDERDEVPAYEHQPWHDSERHAELLAATMAWALSAEAVPELDAQKANAERLRDERPDLTAMSEAALIARARSMVPWLQEAFETGMVVSSMASIGPGILGAICDGLGDPTLAIRLLGGIEVDSAAPSHAMWALGEEIRASAELTAAFDAGTAGVLDRLATSGTPAAVGFLERFAELQRRYGSRGANEWDVLAATWEVRPDAPLAAIDLMRRSDPSQAPAVRHAAAVAERDRAAATVRERLAGDPDALASFESAMRSSQLLLSGRERYKTNCIMLVGEMRMALRELGRRLVAAGAFDVGEQVFMLTDDELPEARLHPARVRDRVRARWTEYQSLRDLEPLFVVNHTAPTNADLRPRRTVAAEHARSGAVLTGVAGSGGVATGRARIVLDPADAEGFEPGDVLVAPQTAPAWVPLFVAASAVVVDVGAMGSHAMIVSRELGIPCVASVQDATKRIPDGAVVTVDGNAGTVTIG